MKAATTFSLLLGFIFTFLFQEQTKGIFITFGQGHFLLAYLYMYKAGKINYVSIIKYIFVLSAMIVFYYFAINMQLLLFITSFYFIIHFALDTYFINNKIIKMDKLLLATMPFFCLSFSRIFIYVGLQNISNFFLLLFPATVIFVCYRWKENEYIKWLLLILSIVVFLSKIFNITWMFQYYMSVIMISHYIMWYIYFLVTKSSTFIKPFIINMLVVNTVLVAMFCYYFFINKSFIPGRLLFQEDYFYLWTLMHFIATFRSDNFKKISLEPAN